MKQPNVWVFFVFFFALGTTSDYFLHLTDQHLEFEYRAGSDPSTWCRSGKGTAGKFGDFGCHSPEALLDATLSEVHRLFPDPQFILWTGDFRRGFETVNGRQEVIDSILNVTRQMLKYFPKAQVWPIYGNHDVSPNNFHDPANAWLYEFTADLWSSWLPQSAQITLRHGGYYEAWPKGSDAPGIIAINSCYYGVWDNVTQGMEDPAGQLEWLEDTLTRAEKRGSKAFLVAHCPFMPDDLTDFFNEKWVHIIRRHPSVLQAAFFGHIHTDIFTVVFDKPGYRTPDAVPILVGYIAPSVATRPGGPHGHNPAFRVFHRDATGLLSHETYWLDLANANSKLEVVFQREYSTLDETTPELKVPSPMTAAGWNKVLTEISSKEAVFGEFWKRYAIQSIDPLKDKCDETCRRTILCAIRYASDVAGHADCIKKGF